MSLPYETMPADVDHLVANDHAVVLRMFEHWESGKGNRRRLADQICFNIALHADAEERTFYPALQQIGDEDGAAKLIEEHQEVKRLVVLVEKNAPGEPALEDAMKQIIAAVRKHASEEEQSFLPKLRKAVGKKKMEELGKKFIKAKRTAPTFAHPAGPSSEAGHHMLDAAAALVDKMRDKASGRVEGLATDATGLLDPQAQRVLDAFSALGPKPFEILEPAEARSQPTLVDAVKAVLREDQKSTEPEAVGEVRNIVIAGPGGDLPLRIYSPPGEGPFPVLLWIHGGGWVLFDVDTYDSSCRGLCNKANAIVVSPEYRRAPEHVFPASHDDVLAAWRWLRNNAASMDGDPQRMAIGGESVGGNMAAATCWQLQKAGEQLPEMQVLVYPLATAEQFGESMSDSADARPLDRPLVSWMAMHAFAGVPSAARDPRVDLLGLSEEQLAGLPRAVVITDGRDPLRSQGEELARHLEAAGVETDALSYPTMMHEFFGMSAVIDKAEEAQREVAARLRMAFAHESDSPRAKGDSTLAGQSPGRVP